MRLSSRFLLASFVASTLLVPATALAAEPSTEQPKSEDVSAGLKGFELMLRPSFGGAASDSPVKFAPAGNVQFQGDPGALMKGASPWGSGFVGQAMIGYRFMPLLSAGLRGGFRSASGSKLDDGSTNLSRSGWDAGFYVRLYPAVFAPSVSKYVDPWFSVGVGYQADAQSFQRSIPTSNGGSVLGNVSLDHHAVSVPIAIGVDYRVAKFLSLGPSFELAINNPIAGCVTTSAPGFQGSTYCSNSEPGKNFVKAETYLAWSGGLDAKVTF
ncbi:MAG TPA: hypothetical protein VM925_37325 [Labilithrix sp.]|nr:hypothetical protein [Labilithrix sp.]